MLVKIFRRFVTELNVGKAAAIGKGTMKAVEFNGDANAVVVYNDGSGYFATGGKCTHYGAPLAHGVLSNGHVYCPWHCACFDIKTGQKKTAPGRQDIATFKTQVSPSGDLIVHLPTSTPSAFVDHNLTRRDPNNPNSFVIVGAGAAALSCAETLRKNGYTGRLQLVTPEKSGPYDRVSLSKNFKMDALKTTLRPESFYEEYGIEILTQSVVTKIDPEAKTVEVNNQKVLGYDKLLIASGSSARVLKPYQSAVGLANVGVIRTIEDHLKLKPLIENAEKVVIIGGSFLGLEAANALKSTFPEKEVTVIEVEEVPLQRIMGSNIGKLLQKKAEEKGVKFYLGKPADAINSAGGLATSVSLNGQNLKCDVLLMATGAQINTSFIPSELLNPDGSVRVSAYLQTDDRNIFAAGDVANFPSVHTGGRARIEHWSVAQDQGEVAAKNMLGMGSPYTGVPFFWSNQAVNIQYIGVAGELGFTEAKDVNGKNEGYINYYFNGQKLVGVAIGNWMGAAVVFSKLMQSATLPNKKQILAGFNFEKIKTLVSSP